MTTAKTAQQRTDRIHAIWQRACLKFRDAAFAAELAGNRIARIPADPRQGTEWATLRKLHTRAVASMDHWHNRCTLLARAEIRTAMEGTCHG